MKLYATITSDRATKGQGGNKFIRIELLHGSTNESKPAGSLELTHNEENETWIQFYSNDGKLQFQRCLTKVKKEKGDIFNRLETSPQDVVDEYNRIKK